VPRAFGGLIEAEARFVDRPVIAFAVERAAITIESIEGYRGGTRSLERPGDEEAGRMPRLVREELTGWREGGREIAVITRRNSSHDKTPSLERAPGSSGIT